MRNPDGTLVGDLGNHWQARTSASLASPLSSDVNENLTEYDLLPVVINHTPVITTNITDSSTPPIRSISLADGEGTYLFSNQDEIVRVSINSSFKFNFEASQPDILNVENGIPVMIPNQTDLQYVWLFNEKPISSYQQQTLNSFVNVQGGTLSFSNVNKHHSGTYVCEVSNDIGTVFSESITLEVYDPTTDPLMYRNLVQNSYGKQGSEGWNSNNGDFVTKQFSSIPLRELKTPHRVDLFGYTADMLHPRPYQIEGGTIRGVDFTKELLKNGTYFSRSPYKYVIRGESTYVKAYQDIELEDIGDLIRGGVYGISGVRAVLGCYIGNAVSNYRVVEELLGVDKRLRRREYFGGAPRMSVENFLRAGPSSFIDHAYVTLEEFENETKLPSAVLGADGSVTISNRVSLQDPWVKRRSNLDQPYYDHTVSDPFNLEQTSVINSQFDQDLHIADQLMPNYEDRFTYGQYVEFSKLALDKLNARTTKLRITIHFVCDNEKLLETDHDGDEVFDFIGWDRPWVRNTFNNLSPDYRTIWQVINESVGMGMLDVPESKKYFLQPDPRPMVTGIVLGLLPITTVNPELFQTDFTNAFVDTGLPVSSTPNVLLDIPFDPTEVNRRECIAKFHHTSNFLPPSSSLADLQFSRNRTYLSLYVRQADGTQSPLPATAATGLFPFVIGQPVDTHLLSPPTASAQVKTFRALSARYGLGVTLSGNSSNGQPYYQTSSWSAPPTASISVNWITSAANAFDPNIYWASTPPSSSYSGSVVDESGTTTAPRPWEGKSRFILYYARRRTNSSFDNTQLNSSVTNTLPSSATSNDQYIKHNSYYLDVDYSTDPDGIVTISRTSELPGSGSVEPIAIPHGINAAGSFYFELPNEVLLSPMSAGGLELPTIAVNGLLGTPVVRMIATPVDFLFNQGLQPWRNLGLLFGEQVQRQVIRSVFPGELEDGLDLEYTSERRQLVEQAREDMFNRLTFNPSVGNRGFSRVQYFKLYGASGLQIQTIGIPGTDTQVPDTLPLAQQFFSDLLGYDLPSSATPWVESVLGLNLDQLRGHVQDILPAALSSVFEVAQVDMQPLVYSATTQLVTQNNLASTSLQLVQATEPERTIIVSPSTAIANQIRVQSPEYATSLYLIQAGQYQEGGAGTPTFGYGNDGLYYYMRYANTYDQQISG